MQYLIRLFLKELASVLISICPEARRWGVGVEAGGYLLYCENLVAQKLPQKQVTFPFKSDDAINPTEGKISDDFTDP